MKVSVMTTYSANSLVTVELPDGWVWDDVDAWSIKWGTLYLTHRDGTEKEIELNECLETDTKRPTDVSFEDEDGNTLESMND